MTVSVRGARMQQPSSRKTPDLHGRIVVITRPAGTASALARKVRALGGVPLRLPGMGLRAAPDADAVRASMRAALADELMVFTSPAAVRHAAALLPLRTAACVLAVGQGTAQALRRHGVAAPLAPRRQDSEGLLELPQLQSLRGRRVALIGASSRGSAAAAARLGAGAAVQCGGPAQPAAVAAGAGMGAIVRGHRGGQQRAPGRGGAGGRVPPHPGGGFGGVRRPAGRGRHGRLSESSHPRATNARVWAASMRS